MKIVTVTPNTAIDRLVTVSQTRSIPGLAFPAGKGINVARTAATLGCPVLALGFVGEAEREFFSTVSSDLFEIRLLPVSGVTRTNTTTFYPDRRVTEHQRTQGFRVSANDWERLSEALDAAIEPPDLVIFSGSLPPGSSPGAYRHLIGLCAGRGVRAVLDSSGEELREGIEAHPFMIKPNLEELGEIYPRQAAWTTAAISSAARCLRESGIQLVVVSLGADGIVAVGDEGGDCWTGSVRLDRPAAATGSVGSGDALTAGIAHGLLRQQPLEAALRLGIACGAANLLLPGPGICDPADIERLSAAVVLGK